MSIQNKKILLQQLLEYSSAINAGKSIEKSYVLSLIIKLKDEILNEEMLAYKPGNSQLSAIQNCPQKFLNK